MTNNYIHDNNLLLFPPSRRHVNEPSNTSKAFMELSVELVCTGNYFRGQVEVLRKIFYMTTKRKKLLKFVNFILRFKLKEFKEDIAYKEQ